MGGMFFQLCLFACCSPHPSSQCLQFLCEFPCPGQLEGSRRASIRLGGVRARLCCEACLVWTFVGPMSFLSTKVASVIALVVWLRGGLALLKAGVCFVVGEGGRWCLGVLGICNRRPLTHTLGFLVLSFGKVTNIRVGKSFAAEVGHSSSMLHESNLLELIFQGNLHSNKRVAV